MRKKYIDSCPSLSFLGRERELKVLIWEFSVSDCLVLSRLK